MRPISVSLSSRFCCCRRWPRSGAWFIPDLLGIRPPASGGTSRRDKPPATLAEWEQRRTALRRQMLAAWGGFPAQPCPLEPRIVGTLQRDGYRVEKIVFQTRPGIWMTANAYVPDASGKVPAVLVVHGHWRGAKQDPVVQATVPGPGQAGLLRAGRGCVRCRRTRFGQSVGRIPRRNGRRDLAACRPAAVRPAGLREPARGRLPAHPARGGRPPRRHHRSQRRRQPDDVCGRVGRSLRRRVPVCSVGNYQAYLGAACCMCEVVPGRCSLPRKANVLALTAPRGLMVVNATRDAVQFSVAEARKSLAWAQPIFDLYDHADHLKHADLRIAPRLQPGHARGDVRLDDAAPEGDGRRLAHPGAGGPPGRPRRRCGVSPANRGPTTL